MSGVASSTQESTDLLVIIEVYGRMCTEMRCDALMYIEIFALTTYQWGRVDEHKF